MALDIIADMKPEKYPTPTYRTHQDKMQKLIVEMQIVMKDYWDGDFISFMEFVKETNKQWMVDYFEGAKTLEEISTQTNGENDMTTRKVNIKMEKMTEDEIIAMIKKCTEEGFPVPAQTIIDASNRKTLAKLNDSGILIMHKTAYGYMFTMR